MAVMKVMVTPFKMSHAALGAPNPAAGHLRPKPLPETPGHSWVCLGHIHEHVCISYLWGDCSFLLGPGAHKVLFEPSKILLHQSCVSFGGSMIGLMVTSSKRANAISRSAAPRAPDPAAGHC